MVYIFVESIVNPVTVQVDPIIENPKFIHLESVVMYNSWYNLKSEGVMKIESMTR